MGTAEISEIFGVPIGLDAATTGSTCGAACGHLGLLLAVLLGLPAIRGGLFVALVGIVLFSDTKAPHFAAMRHAKSRRKSA